MTSPEMLPHAWSMPLHELIPLLEPHSSLLSQPYPRCPGPHSS